MISSLYEGPLRDRSNKGSIYIYSDTHFEDEDCKLMDPKWVTPEEQVSRINKVVHKSDTLILLGDVGNVEWVKHLTAGYKILILGNHDVGVNNYKRKIENGVDNKLFDEVYSGPLIIGEKLILSHEPLPDINWALNIHGHDHSGVYIDKYHFNVCSNTIGYTPVSLKPITISGRLNKIKSIHRTTIDEATIKAKRKKNNV